MKVNIGFELSEAELRRLRAGIGRSGMATRKEVRIFVDRVVRSAVASLPEPKPKRASCPPPPKPKPSTASTLCAHCDKPQSEHSAMGTCPLSLTYGRHTRFKAAS